jgi:nucleoside-diphosphate-sugar epimerase
MEDTTMKVLVTGGARYIGGYTILALLDRGFDPILDDLSGVLATIVEHAYVWELALANRPALLDSPVGG